MPHSFVPAPFNFKCFISLCRHFCFVRYWCSILKVGLEVRDTWTLNPNQLQQSIFKWARIVWSASAQTHYSWSDRGAFLLNANAPCKMERIDVKCLTNVLEQIHHTEWFGHIYIYIYSNWMRVMWGWAEKIKFEIIKIPSSKLNSMKANQLNARYMRVV